MPPSPARVAAKACPAVKEVIRRNLGRLSPRERNSPEAVDEALDVALEEWHDEAGHLYNQALEDMGLMDEEHVSYEGASEEFLRGGPPSWTSSQRVAETVGFHGYGMSPSQMRLPGPQFSDAKPIPSGDVEEAVEYLEETTPGLLVGYSRGGAVVMLALKQVDGKKPKVIYVAPAWRRGWATTSPPSTQGEILHGDEDDKVPLQHSCDLAQRTGMPLHVFPGRNHVSILKDKLNPGGGKRVPTDKLRECVQTMPDWGTSGSGSQDEVGEQVSFVEKIARRVASRHLKVICPTHA